MDIEVPERSPLANSRRLVVKIGSRVLVRSNGRPELSRLRALVRDIVAARRQGREVVVVTSGAIGTGMEALGWKHRPRSMPDLQAAAAVGQLKLMALYDRAFRVHRCRIGQVLLTHDALTQRERHLNARNTLLRLLEHGVIPIINENDAVATEEIRFGDNDLLSSLVAMLLGADLLVLLTTVNGLRAPVEGGRTRRVRWLPAVTPAALKMVFGSTNEISTGGMASKLQSAHNVARVGIPVVIADGRRPGVLSRILAGEDVGTLIGQPQKQLRWDARERWIGFFHRPKGAVVVDDGAVRAIVQEGRSLLPIGVRAVVGRFVGGDVVDVKDGGGRVIARGLVSYSSKDLERIRGRRTSEIAGILGSCPYEEVIHRDNMVVLLQPAGGPDGHESA